MNWLHRIWHQINEWDTWLFLKINHDWNCPFLDSITPWLRHANNWIPLYVLILLFVIWKLKKKVLWWLLFMGLAAALTDIVSSQILKDLIGRVRPCNEPLLVGHMRTYMFDVLHMYAPQSGSFTSSHAANHFDAAVFIFFSLRPYLKKWGYLFFAWAAVICYAQVYVGVHYPLDILGGAIVGSSIGYFMAWAYNKKCKNIKIA